MGQVTTDHLVTVVVPVRNEEKTIEACLASITAQTYKNIEVLVVDGESDDMTACVVRHYAATKDDRVRLVANRDRIIPAGLNVALRHAAGTLMVRVDGHSRVAPDYIGRAVAHFATGNWGGVGGRKDGVGHSSAGRAIAVAMSSPFGVGNSVYHYGTDVQTTDHIPFGTYPVAIAREVGGWDERFPANEDFEFDYRVREAGHELLFDPQIRIEWDCRQSVRSLLGQYVRYGRGKARVARTHPKSVAFRHMAPPLLFLWMAAALVATPFVPLLGVLAMAPYLLGVGVASLLTARQVKRGDRKHLPLIFPAMHLGWGYGFCRGVADIIQGKLRPLPKPLVAPEPHVQQQRVVA